MADRSNTAACRPHHLVTDNDLYYLRSIQRNLQELHEIATARTETIGYGLANEVLADNRDWLDHFIARFDHASP